MPRLGHGETCRPSPGFVCSPAPVDTVSALSNSEHVQMFNVLLSCHTQWCGCVLEVCEASAQRHVADQE